MLSDPLQRVIVRIFRSFPCFVALCPRLLQTLLFRGEHEFLEQWGGWHPARERWFELEKLPEANLAEGVKIDECSTYRATRFAVPV